MPCMLILNIYSFLANSVPGQNGSTSTVHGLWNVVHSTQQYQNGKEHSKSSRLSEHTPIVTFPEQRWCCTEYHDAEWAILSVHRWQFGRSTEYRENKSVDRISVHAVWSKHCPFHCGRCPMQSTCHQAVGLLPWGIVPCQDFSVNLPSWHGGCSMIYVARLPWCNSVAESM